MTKGKIGAKLIILSFLLLPCFANGDGVGLDIGYFYPSSSSVRDLYGNGWLLMGVYVPINVYQAFKEERTEYISLDYIHNSYSGTWGGSDYDASVVNVPLMYNTRYRRGGKNFYYTYGIGFNYLKVKLTMGGATESDSEFDMGGQFAFGYGTDNLSVELRYIEFGRSGNTGIALTLSGRF